MTLKKLKLVLWLLDHAVYYRLKFYEYGTFQRFSHCYSSVLPMTQYLLSFVYCYRIFPFLTVTVDPGPLVWLICIHDQNGTAMTCFLFLFHWFIFGISVGRSIISIQLFSVIFFGFRITIFKTLSVELAKIFCLLQKLAMGTRSYLESWCSRSVVLDLFWFMLSLSTRIQHCIALPLKY